jgi:iron complex outermembrane receptor protein
MTHDSIRNAVRLALTAGVAASFVNAPAFAEDDDAAKLDRVEVTGSRIKRTQLEGAMPVTSVTREQIEQTGISTIGDLLQELPAAGAALNTNFNNGGDGSTRVDLRNLGTQRVLVLVNGRRWLNAVGGGGVNGSVDLNTIPISIIERIEVLKDGASAVYGSDAIAGVINIITRRDFDGAQANATIGEFDEGDGRQELYDFSIGASSARASAFLNASYYKQEEVAAGDRRISQEPLFGTQNVLGSSTTPQGRFRVRDPNNVLAGQMAIGGPLRFWTGQCTVAQAPGQTCGAAGGVTTGGATTDLLGNNNPDLNADFRQYNTTNDPYNFAPDNYLGTPSDRWSLYAQGRYDVTDNVTFTTEALYHKRTSEQLLAAMPVTFGPGAAGISADGTMVGIDATNPFNPFNLTLDPVAPTDAGALQLFAIQRRFVETGGRSFNQDVNLYRFGAGFEGNFEMAGRVFDWNVNYTFTEGESADITFGLFNTARIASALGPVANCTDPCVALNLFGGVGSINQAMLDWVLFNAHDIQGYQMRNYTGNVSGEIFDLPAGPVGLALGYEYRQEEAFDDPDALIAAGNTTGNARTPTAGSYSLSEVYAELAIPVLSGAPLAEVLELTLAARSSDYTTFGSTTNAKLGIRWQPITDLLVRATFQEGFRAPNIGELFLGSSDSFPTLSDLCSNPGAGASGGLDLTPDTFDDDADPNTPEVPRTNQDQIDTLHQRLANCFNQASGGQTPQIINNPDNPNFGAHNVFVPNDGSYGQSNAQIRITIGGNADLTAETADSTTLGFVYSPSFVDGLSLSFDWYKIEINQAIAPLGGGRIMTECYDRNIQESCDKIQRFASGDVEDLININQNLDAFKVEGIDLNVVYRAGELPFVPGEWKFTWDTAYVDEFDLCTLNCQSFVQINAGDGALPAFKSNLDVEWSWGDWEAVWRMRFIGRQYEFCSSSYVAIGFPCSDPQPGVSQNALGATTYHNAQVSYHLSDWDTRFTFGIQNIGDKSPPLSSQAFANSFDATTYEVPGRFPYFRVSKTF